jgi:hypothetical protein
MTPRFVHFVTLTTALPVLVLIGRHQWFFFDEWFFIADPDNLLAPHNGHLSLVPAAAYHVLLSVFGLSTYLPFFVLLLLVHLLFAHQLWLAMVRSGVHPWIAVALDLVVIYLGAGAENILWAFQIGFVGALAFGLGALLIVTRSAVGWRGFLAAGLLSTAALASSGTAIPIVAVAAVVAIRVHGLRRALVTFLPPVALFGLWYLALGRNSQLPSYPNGIGEVLVDVPAYIVRMFAGGFDALTPLAGIGTILLIAIIGWVVVHASDLLKPATLLPYAILAAGLAFAAITAFSRIGIGIGAASAQRYVYVTIALAVPLLGLMLTRLALRGTAPLVATVIVVLLVALYNLSTLAVSANNEAAREQTTRQRLYAALDYANAHPDEVDGAALPDPDWVLPITVDKLLALQDQGWIEVGEYTPSDLDYVEKNIVK